MIGARMHYVTIRRSELAWKSASVPTSSHPSWIKAIVRASAKFVDAINMPVC